MGSGILGGSTVFALIGVKLAWAAEGAAPCLAQK
jgi:hypothetical protein